MKGHMIDQLVFTKEKIGEHERLTTVLPNELVVVLPLAVFEVANMGEYELAALKALQTQEGLAFVQKAFKEQPRYEVNLPIGKTGSGVSWVTTTSVSQRPDGKMVFTLYHGAN